MNTPHYSLLTDEDGSGDDAYGKVGDVVTQDGHPPVAGEGAAPKQAA